MRTLLIAPGAIGDCIMRFPAMEALRSESLEVWLPRPVVPLVLFADRVRALADTGIDSVGITAPALPAFQTFDRIVSWYGSARADFQNAVAGLPFEFRPALAAAPPAAIPRIPLRGPNHGSVVLHPFSGSKSKNFPLDGFRQLARHFREVRWLRGPEETLEGAVRFEDLGSLAVWLSGAALYIGNDSGITHLAAALGVRTIALFGPTDPSIWCPPGPHVRWLRFDSALRDLPALDLAVESGGLALRHAE